MNRSNNRIIPDRKKLAREQEHLTRPPRFERGDKKSQKRIEKRK